MDGSTGGAIPDLHDAVLLLLSKPTLYGSGQTFIRHTDVHVDSVLWFLYIQDCRGFSGF